MRAIIRKTMLYKTGVEYGDYTMNHVLGCAHGCKYPCYAFMMAKRFGKVSSYQEWISPKIVCNTLELLDKEIPHMKSRIKSVQLCFTTDPFMCGYEEIQQMSLKSIAKLNAAGIKCSVLTKGILPFTLSEYSKSNEYGITLVTLDEKFREKMEPNASDCENRLSSLLNLHNRGFYTWVSIEPYPTPNIYTQNLSDILNAIGFVDKIIFGRTHYSKEVTSFKENKEFYNQQAAKVIDFCQHRNISYHIKTGTIS